MSSALLLLLLLLEKDEEEGEEREAILERNRAMKSLRDNYDPFNISDELFTNYFCLPKDLCRKLMEDLAKKDNQRTSLPFVVRFFCALYFYTRGSNQKAIATNFFVPLSQTSVSRAIIYISELLHMHKHSEVCFPVTNEQQLAIKAQFHSKFDLKGVIGVIGCSHIAVLSLNLAYMNYEGKNSINVQAVCDTNLKFLSVNANSPGSMSNSSIWGRSKVRKFMKKQQGSWLVGDESYQVEPWLLTPLAEPSTESEMNYNKAHKKCRSVIERSFELMKTRFQCLSNNRVIRYRPEMVGKIINSCVILHNMMVDRFPNENLNLKEEEEEEVNCQITVAIDNNNDLHREGVKVRQSVIQTFEKIQHT